MIGYSFEKGSSEELSYSMIWSKWLSGSEKIIESSWSSNSNLTLNAASFSEHSTSVRVGGGVLGTEYRVTNLIRTNIGQVAQRSFKLKIVER